MSTFVSRWQLHYTIIKQPIVSNKLALKAKMYLRHTNTCFHVYVHILHWLETKYLLCFYGFSRTAFFYVLSMISEPHPLKFRWYPFLYLKVWPKHSIYQFWCFYHKVNDSPIFTGLTAPLSWHQLVFKIIPNLALHIVWKRLILRPCSKSCVTNHTYKTLTALLFTSCTLLMNYNKIE